MARERHQRNIEITDIPELLRLVRQLQNSDEPLVLQEESRDVAIVRPIKGPRRPRLPRGKVLTQDDSLWKLVGSATSASPTDATKKHEYLNEAYEPRKASVVEAPESGLSSSIQRAFWPWSILMTPIIR